MWPWARKYLSSSFARAHMAYECRVSLDAHKFLVINPSHFAAIALYHSTTLLLRFLFLCCFAASRCRGVGGRRGQSKLQTELASGANELSGLTVVSASDLCMQNFWGPTIDQAQMRNLSASPCVLSPLLLSVCVCPFARPIILCACQ